MSRKQRTVLISIMTIISACAVGWLFTAGKQGAGPAQPQAPARPSAELLIIASSDAGFNGYEIAAEMGARVAADELNSKNGMLGKTLRIVNADASSLPNLTSRRPMLALFAGTEAEKPTAISWAESAGVPLFILTDGPCRTRTPKSKDQASPAVWSLGLTWQSETEPLLVYLNEKYSHPDKDFTFVFLGGDTATSRREIEFTRDASEALGFKTIDTQINDVRIADYFPIMRNILNHAPHVLYVANPGVAGREFLHQAAKLGMGKEMAFAGLTTLDAELFDPGDRALEGTYTVGRFSREIHNPESDKFSAALKALNAPENVASGGIAAAAFTAVHLAAHAYKKAGKEELQPFATALEGLEISSPNGKVRMNALNHVLEQPIFVAHREGGSWKSVQDLGTAVHPRLEGCGGENPGSGTAEGTENASDPTAEANGGA